MKKLSIEEKAKRYDEAIQRANELNYISDKDSLQCKTVEHIFPELKESEDERIRKEIIAFLTYYHTGQGNSLKYDDGWIAWLKKQGEPTEINPTEFDSQLNKLLKQFEALPKEELANSLSFYLNVIQNDGTYKEEKQGEKTEPIEDFDTEFERQISHLIASIINKEYSYKKAFVKWASGALLNYAKQQIEQKPVDKIEPKFKVGDWVVDEKGVVKQILSYKHGVYKHTCGYSARMFEDKWRMWDITKDAKDGDVLVGGEQLFLFERMNTSNSFYAHCNYHFIGYDSLSVYNCSYSINNIYPATKEQRDLLFQKMQEAGYEWDAEQKQLKKIEQKTVWSEEEELHIRELEGLVKRVWAIAEHENDKDTIHKMSDLSFFLKTLKPQLKQECSEEEKEAIN